MPASCAACCTCCRMRACSPKRRIASGCRVLPFVRAQVAGDWSKRTDVRLALSIVEDIGRSRAKIGDLLRAIEMAQPTEPPLCMVACSDAANSDVERCTAVAAAARPCIVDGEGRRSSSAAGSGSGWFSSALARLGPRSKKAKPGRSLRKGPRQQQPMLGGHHAARTHTREPTREPASCDRPAERSGRCCGARIRRG